MSKLRVYQLAKELGISSKELIEKLNDLSVVVNNHMSTLEEEDANLIIELFTDKPEEKKITVQEPEKASQSVEKNNAPKQEKKTKKRVIKASMEKTTKS